MDSALLFTRAAGQDLRLYGSQAAAVAAWKVRRTCFPLSDQAGETSETAKGHRSGSCAV